MAVKTITIGAGTLTLGESGTLRDFSSQVTACRLEPSVNKGDPTNVLSGEQAPGDRSETFVLAGTILQDFGEADAVVEFCFTNRGTEMPFEFIPNTTKGRKVTGRCVVEAVNIGGDVKTKPTSDFSFDLVGEPTLGSVA